MYTWFGAKHFCLRLNFFSSIYRRSFSRFYSLSQTNIKATGEILTKRLNVGVLQLLFKSQQLLRRQSWRKLTSRGWKRPRSIQVRETRRHSWWDLESIRQSFTAHTACDVLTGNPDKARLLKPVKFDFMLSSFVP